LNKDFNDAKIIKKNVVDDARKSKHVFITTAFKIPLMMQKSQKTCVYKD